MSKQKNSGQQKTGQVKPHGPVSERFMRHYYGASGYIRHGAMLRAKYFPPQTPQMCREYCPICKRICEFPEGHIIPTFGDKHMCAMEHCW